jgi:hypothetical protein
VSLLASLTPLAVYGGLWVLFALRVAQVHCTALHCTALHCTALHCRGK